MPKGRFLTTECNAEPYIRYYDGYLTWQWQDNGMVPAFPAVYNGTIAMFGRGYYGGLEACKARAAQQLVFGEQIGWCDPGFVNNKPRAEYLRKAIRLRYTFRSIVSRGEMLRPIILTSNAQPITSDWQWFGERIVTTAPVLTGSWKCDRKIVIFFANLAEKPVTSRFRIGYKEYGLPGKLQAVIYGDEGKPTGNIDLDLTKEQAIDLAPTQIIAWECNTRK